MTTKTTDRRAARRALAAIAIAAALPAQAKMDPALERRYAGVYSTACADRTALTAKIWGDTMIVEQGGRSVSASNVRNAPARATTAPDFKAAFVGDVRGGDGLQFAMQHNAAGLFATLEGGPKSLAAIGPTALGQKLRHCDPNRNALPGAAPPSVAAGPTDLLRDAAFRERYFKALGPLAKERWLTKLDGPAPPLKKVKVAGGDYTLAAVCKPHDCADNNMVLLVAANGGMVSGKVFQRGRSTTIGAPPPAVAAELERLWTQEWRGKP